METNKENPSVNTNVNNTEVEDSTTIRFYPPAYIQRYNRVRDEVQKQLLKLNRPASILEVGCAEFGMHCHLKNLQFLEKIMYLDIDKELLTQSKFRVTPLPYDHLIPRETPLNIQVFSGSVTETDPRVQNASPALHAIIGIEILEHLDEDIEVEFIRTLFGEYAPPVVILTTPNSDFNTVLGLPFGKFRHWDHRFELSRQEFQDWCTTVCELFPDYIFRIEGICTGPPGTEEVYGCLSQMAVFEKKSSPQKFQQDCTDPGCNAGEAPYELLEEIEYPWRPRPSLKERFLAEFKYCISNVVFSYTELQEFEAAGETEVVERGAFFLSRCKLFPDFNDLDLGTIRTWIEEEGYECLDDGDKPLDFQVILKVPQNDSSFEEDSYNDNADDVPVSFDREALGGSDDDWD